MDEYNETLQHLKDISFDKIGTIRGKKEIETSNYLSYGYCTEYLRLILHANLFRSKLDLLDDNGVLTEDTHAAIKSAVLYITGRNLMNDIATICQQKNDSKVVFKLTTWAPVVFTFLTLLGKNVVYFIWFDCKDLLQ